jgi:phasin
LPPKLPEPVFWRYVEQASISSSSSEARRHQPATWDLPDNQEETAMSDTTQGKPQRGARTSASAAAEDIAAETARMAETLRTEVPSSVTDLLDKGLARAKDAHEKAAAILEHSTEAFEEAYGCATRGSAEYRQKLIEITRVNTNAAFDMAREFAEAKTLPELFERAVAHQRKQFELFTAQMKDLSSLTQKVVTETAEPIRHTMAEPFKIAS